uniref:putative disease resistance RPP13-like protein 1 n=1 Tax=Erigeron canadensis TaxID=72917 RepID=UPI001CB8BCF0|nr:putative disease resistance RPP13-like protein 1 [Erigeron canadensis]
MAEVLVSAVVTVLVDKLYSGALMNFARSQGIDSQLKKWKKKLPLIQAVLADAGQKEITQKAVELWLMELQDVAYDIDDVLDDIATEVMRRKLNQQESHANTTASKVMKIIPVCCTNFIPHNFMYGREISSKLDEITARLDDLFQQKNDLGLNVNVEKSSRTNKPLEETSLVDESEILGREEDKQALLEKLLGAEVRDYHNVKIVSIVGLGGVGKTTLARVLYNDEQVKGHFELRAWVCVSDEFDVFNVSKAIYQAVCGETKEFANLNLLHVALKEKLSNKRFLLVLDDVWNEDHQSWIALKQPLVGAPGSKVIVTTRNTIVASVMNSVQPHNLGVLSDEIALSLLAQYALEEQNFDKHPSLISIAQGIVKKCDGLPLALVALGRVLKTKGIDDVAWEELLRSEIWSLHDSSYILPALKLSYYHLPSHLKQLFAYCSMFPKDYEFEKKKLVLMWMAQGFLSQPKGNNQPMESLGVKYFEELLSRSFFQPLGNDESRYKMHDLMNDLATSVAGEFFFRLDDKNDLNDRSRNFEKYRHFSFIDQEVAQSRKFKQLYRIRSLRTFLPLSTPWQRLKASDSIILELISKLESLRVLSLSNCSITEVSQSIGSLKHLRYLNLSNTDIKRLPEQVSELYNVQSLLVRDCHQLSSLPDSFAKLINLRHLDMTNTPSLKKLPLGIGELRNLQTLSKVIIEEENGFQISELKWLKDLQGQLYIKGLDKVIDPAQAKDANLQQKKGLEDLYMEWGTHHGKPTTEYEVLERLRAPHNKLKKLEIAGYGGTEFPRWIGDPSFHRLTELTLRDCKNCTHLPTFGQTSLRKLGIYSCPKLVSIKGEEEMINVGSSIIRSLRQVILSNCDSLESYCCQNSVESLYIRNCLSMTTLSFSIFQEEDLPSSLSSYSSLKILEVSHCKNIKSIFQEHLQSLTSLEVMGIYKCPSMEDSFPSCGSPWPPNLWKLEIGELKKPMSEWRPQNYPSSLVELELYGRDSGVVSFGIMEQQQDHNNTSSSCFLLPPSLTFLRIVGFEEVESISQVLQHLPQLQQLYIINCPKLRDVLETTSSLRVNVSYYQY